MSISVTAPRVLPSLAENPWLRFAARQFRYGGTSHRQHFVAGNGFVAGHDGAVRTDGHDPHRLVKQ